MKRIIPVIFFILFFLQKNSGQQLQFDYTDSIRVLENGDTLHNAWSGGINFPLFSEIDLDGDGIHDLFMYDMSNGRISTFINDGTPGTNAWHYAPQFVSKFPPLFQWALLADYNCDGKADIFTLASSQDGMKVYRNDYNAVDGLQFTLVTDNLKEEYLFPPNFHASIFASQVQLPTFGDVDGDGDMDILGTTTVAGRVVFHKNYSLEHGFGCDSLDFKIDTETWGNFIVATNNQSVYARNDCFGCRTAPVIPGNQSLENYDQSVAAPRDDSYFSIFMIDANGDDKMDLIVGDVGAINSLLLVNGGTPSAAQMISEDTIFPSYDVPAVFDNFHFHAYIDVDNDGVKDLIVESGKNENWRNGVWYYKNTGTTASPVFSYQTSSFLVDQMIDVGEASCPVLFDADHDGLQDLIVGNFGIHQYQNNAAFYYSGLYRYKNTGTISSPEFQLVDTDYAGINSLFIQGPIYPAFGDLDGDGDEDLIIGGANGKLQYFTNDGGVPAGFQLTGVNYMAIDIGGTSAPQIIDLNHDNLLDLVIGGQNGHINYFQNTGTTSVPAFTASATNSTLGGIVIQTGSPPVGFTAPYFFNDHGVLKLLLSCGGGNVLLYDSIDGNLGGNFHLVDTIVSEVEGVRSGFNLAVSGGDLNNDGLTDMLLGLFGGGLHIYMQRDPSTGIANISSSNNNFFLGPNPANDECKIHFSNLLPGTKNHLNIFNYLGEAIVSKNISTKELTLNTRDLPSGMYVVQFISSGNSEIKKLVISH